MSCTVARILMIVLLASTAAAVRGADDEADARAVQIRQETIDSRMTPPNTEVVVTTLGRQALRVDSEFDPSGAAQLSTIFRSSDRGFLILAHDTEEALIYDREQARIAAQRRREFEGRMSEQLADDESPAGEAIARMKRLREESARLQQERPQSAIEFRTTSETGEIEGLPWVRVVETRQGAATRELLVTPWKELATGVDAVRVFQEMSDFFDDIVEISGGVARMPNPYQHFEKLGGFPLVIRQLDGNGNAVIETRVISIEVVEESSGVFDNPGYPQQGVAEHLLELDGPTE